MPTLLKRPGWGISNCHKLCVMKKKHSIFFIIVILAISVLFSCGSSGYIFMFAGRDHIEYKDFIRFNETKKSLFVKTLYLDSLSGRYEIFFSSHKKKEYDYPVNRIETGRGHSYDIPDEPIELPHDIDLLFFGKVILYKKIEPNRLYVFVPDYRNAGQTHTRINEIDIFIDAIKNVTAASTESIIEEYMADGYKKITVFDGIETK